MTRLKKRIVLILAILPLILITASLSCRTYPPVVVKVEIPEIDWPVFPDPSGIVRIDGEVITMPVSYWKDLTKYVIDVEAGIAEIEASREAAKE